MPAAKLEHRIHELQQKIAQLQEQLKSKQQQHKTIERKQDTKRKILLGAMLQSWIEQGRLSDEQIQAGLDSFLVRDSDRTLFGLPPKVKPEDLTASNGQVSFSVTTNTIVSPPGVPTSDVDSKPSPHTTKSTRQTQPIPKGTIAVGEKKRTATKTERAQTNTRAAALTDTVVTGTLTTERETTTPPVSNQQPGGSNTGKISGNPLGQGVAPLPQAKKPSPAGKRLGEADQRSIEKEFLLDA